MWAINISVAASQFSHCYLYSGMRKKCGALLSEQPSYNDTKWNQMNMKERDERNSHISSTLHMIHVSSNNDRHPVTKTLTPFIWSMYLLMMINTLLLRPSLHFTTLHPTTLHSTSLHLSTLHFFPFKLHPTTVHSTSLHLSILHFFPFKLHPTTLHYTCRHLTSSHLNFTQLHFTPLHYTCRHFTSSHLNFTQLHFTPLVDTSLLPI